MATDEVEEIDLDSEPESDDAVSEPKPKLSLGNKKIKIFAMLLLIMVGQVGVIYFFVPAPASTTDATSEDDSAVSADATDDTAFDEVVEVEIDTFNVTNSGAGNGTVIHISFKLVAIVSKNIEHEFDTAVNETNQHRVRQAILQVARSTSRNDLNDPNLRAMKRRIREEINKVLRKSDIIEVVISNFSTLEQ